MCIYIYMYVELNLFVRHQKLTQQGKSTTFQFKKRKKPAWCEWNHFLSLGNRLHSASVTSPEFQRVGSSSCSSELRGAEKGQPRNKRAALGQVPVPPLGMHRRVAEVKPPANERRWLPDKAFFTPGPPQPVPGPLNTCFEEEFEPGSIRILLCGPIFHSQTIKAPPNLSHGGRGAGDGILWPHEDFRSSICRLKE